MRAAVFVLPEHSFLIEFEFWHLFLKNLPFFTGILGTALALILNTIFKDFIFVIKLTKIGRFIYIFFNRKWFFDLIYNHFVVNKFLDFGYYVSFKLIDKAVLEWIGPMGLTKLVYVFSNSIISLQTGIIYNYALFMFVGAILFIGLSFFLVYSPTAAVSFFKVVILLGTIFIVSKNINKKI